MLNNDDLLLEKCFSTLSFFAFLFAFDQCAIVRPNDKPRQPAFRAAAFLLTDKRQLEKLVINKEKEGEKPR